MTIHIQRSVMYDFLRYIYKYSYLLTYLLTYLHTYCRTVQLQTALTNTVQLLLLLETRSVASKNLDLKPVNCQV